MNRRVSRALVAVAALVAAGTGAAVIATVATASSPGASTLVPITPCRLLDTRPGTDTVGTRSTPVGAGETLTVTTWGTNGNCTIPSGATGLSMNVVAIGPTASSFLTVFPADVARPSASALNWVAGQAPTPNAVTARLGADGRLSFYNLAGTVDLAVDVVGYYEPVGGGSTGPQGPQGPVGPTGPQGPGADPAQVIWVAESGGDFTTISEALASITNNSSANRYLIRVAPGTYVENAGIDLKDWVDIEGSGATTVIASNGSGVAGAAIRGDTNVRAEVRRLRIVSTGQRGIDAYKSDLTLRELAIDLTTTAIAAVAVDIDAADVEIDDVSIDGSTAVTGGRLSGVIAVGNSTVDVDGLHGVLRSTGGFPDCAFVEMTDAALRASNLDLTIDGCNNMYGITGLRSSLTVVDAGLDFPSAAPGTARAIHVNTSTAVLDSIQTDGNSTGGLGLYSYSSDVLLSDSSLRGSTGAVYAAVATRMRLSTSVVEGGTSGLFGMCTGVVDANYAPYTCS